MSIFEALLNCDLTPAEEINTFMNIVDSVIDDFTCDDEIFECTHVADGEFDYECPIVYLKNVEQYIEYRLDGGSLAASLNFLVKEINSLWAGIVANFAHFEDLYVFTIKFGDYHDERVFSVTL